MFAELHLGAILGAPSALNPGRSCSWRPAGKASWACRAPAPCAGGVAGVAAGLARAAGAVTRWLLAKRPGPQTRARWRGPRPERQQNLPRSAPARSWSRLVAARPGAWPAPRPPRGAALPAQQRSFSRILGSWGSGRGTSSGGSRPAGGSHQSQTSWQRCHAGAARVLLGCASSANPSAPRCSAGVPWAGRGGAVLGDLGGGRSWLRPRRSQAISHPSALEREVFKARGPFGAPQPPGRGGAQGLSARGGRWRPPEGVALSGLHRWR